MGVCFWANMRRIQFLWLFSRQLILPTGLKSKRRVPSSKSSFKTRPQVHHEVTLGRTPLERQPYQTPFIRHHFPASPGFGALPLIKQQTRRGVSNSASSLLPHKLLYTGFTVCGPQQSSDVLIQRDKATNHPRQKLRETTAGKTNVVQPSVQHCNRGVRDTRDTRETRGS